MFRQINNVYRFSSKIRRTMILMHAFNVKHILKSLIFSFFYITYPDNNNNFIENQQFIKGEFGNNGIIESPNFPSDYNMDFDTEFILSCVSGDDCRISLIFTDFSLSPLSVMEVKYFVYLFLTNIYL